MINLAVINLKDVIRYLFKIAIVFLILWFVSRLISNQLLNNSLHIDIKDITNLSEIDHYKLIEIIDEQIPGMLQLNKSEEVLTNNIKKINPMKMIFEMQLGMAYNLEKNEDNENNENNKNKQNFINNENNNNEIEHAKTRTEYRSN